MRVTRSIQTLIRQTTVFTCLLVPFIDAKPVSLDLIDESYQPKLDRRQAASQQIGYISTNPTLNTSTYDLFVDVNIGDRNQTFRLAVYFTPQTWVPRRWSKDDACGENFCQGDTAGFWSYDPATSITSRNLTDAEDDFNLGYGRYQAQGKWTRDQFSIGGTHIDDVSFGIAHMYTKASTLGLGSWGMYPDENDTYPTILSTMATNRNINTELFGVSLGDSRQREDVGKSIVFGGIDVAKFRRPLMTYKSTRTNRIDILGIDIVIGGQKNITLTDTDSSGVSSTSVKTGEISVGSPVLSLIPSMYTAIFKALGRSNTESRFFPTLPPEDDGLLFRFPNNFTIFIPFVQMMLPAADTNGEYELQLSQVKEGQTFIGLGNPFFRGAYVVYDYTNEEISLATAINYVSSQDIREVGAGGASVSALGLFEPEPENNSTTGEQPASNNNNSPAIVGPVVGGVLSGMAFIAICGVVWFYARKRGWRSPELPPPPPEYEEHYPELEVNGTDKLLHTARMELDGQRSPTFAVAVTTPSSVNTPTTGFLESPVRTELP